MALPPFLKRFDLLVTKDRNPPGDVAQVPAAALVAFYKQGATVQPTEAIVIPPGYFEDIAIPVWHTGTLRANEDVLVNADATKRLRATHVDTPNLTVWVQNQGATAIVLLGGERLYRDPDRPPVYQDPTGQVSTGSSSIATVGGRAYGYLGELRFDYVVTITGTAIRRLYADGDGSYVVRR